MFWHDVRMRCTSRTPVFACRIFSVRVGRGKSAFQLWRLEVMYLSLKSCYVCRKFVIQIQGLYLFT